MIETTELQPCASPEGALPPQPTVLKNRPFLLLLFGSGVSTLGDQVSLVALPMFVLSLTGDPAALGTILSLMAIPRAVFILLGGAVVDRMSPWLVLIVARGVNAALMGILAATALGTHAQLSMVGGLAVAIGIATAFSYPAGPALLPFIVGPSRLPSANSAVAVVRQVCTLAGPPVGGWLVMWGSTWTGSATQGPGIALALDAASFGVSLAALGLVRRDLAPLRARPKGNIAGELLDGLSAVWTGIELRYLALYLAAAAMLASGVVLVVLPFHSQEIGGAQSFGLLLSANGLGTLVGSLGAAWATQFVKRRIGLAVVLSDLLAGVSLIGLGFTHSLEWSMLLLFCIGLGGGLVQIMIVSWIQQQVSASLLGRVMSIFLFIICGLTAISGGLTGYLLRGLSSSTLFITAGVGLSVLTGTAAALGGLPLRSVK